MPIKTLFLGDENFCKMLQIIQRRTSQKTENGKDFLDLAVEDQTVKQLLRRAKCVSKSNSLWFCEDIEERDVIVMIGTNDLLHETHPKKLEPQYLHLFRSLVTINPKKIHVCTIPPCKNLESVEEVNLFILSFFRERGFNVIVLEDIINQNMMDRDGIHLNREGLENLWKAIVRNIQEGRKKTSPFL